MSDSTHHQHNGIEFGSVSIPFGDFDRKDHLVRAITNVGMHYANRAGETSTSTSGVGAGKKTTVPEISTKSTEVNRAAFRCAHSTRLGSAQADDTANTYEYVQYT